MTVYITDCNSEAAESAVKEAVADLEVGGKHILLIGTGWLPLQRATTVYVAHCKTKAAKCLSKKRLQIGGKQSLLRVC